MFRKLCNFSIKNRSVILTVMRNYVPRAPRIRQVENPGVDSRMKYFKEEIMEHLNDPEHFESLEPEFMSLNETHKRHEQELRKTLDRRHTLMIGRKYFKSNSPNLLTFNEKEQIRNLHTTDPEEWTIDKLSQSFPADPYTISKLLRAKWQPKDMNRVIKHDKTVKSNWEDFKKGKLQVEPMLGEHLKKFAFRDFNELTKRPTNKKFGIELPRPRKTEFQNIITSCKKYAVSNNDNNLDDSSSLSRVRKITSDETRIPEIKPRPGADSYVLEGKKQFSSKNITLEELQKQSPDIKMPDTFNKISKFDELTPKLKEQKLSDVITLDKSDEEILNSLEVKTKISIPRKLWKKGKIYQVADCFYADDGDFLYRVPGLMH